MATTAPTSDNSPSAPPGGFTFGEPDVTTPDPGLFGPRSVSWTVNGDVAGAVGGLRALLFQAAHPEAMAGVARHSVYRDDPWGRLFRTGEYIAVLTFGTTAEAERAAARVRGIHRRLGLDDPRLLLWVHAGFVDSLLTSYRRSGAPLSDAQADQYVREQVVAGELVGIPTADLFTTMSELRAYVDATRPGLQITGQAVEAAWFVMNPPMRPVVRWLTPAQPAWTAVASTAFGLLPGWMRSGYARAAAPHVGAGWVPGASSLPGLLAGAPTTSLQATLAARTLRASLLRLPESLRTGPHLQAAQQRLGLDD